MRRSSSASRPQAGLHHQDLGEQAVVTQSRLCTLIATPRLHAVGDVSTGWRILAEPQRVQEFAAAPDTESAAKQDKLVIIFNFFDELRRIAPGKQ